MFGFFKKFHHSSKILWQKLVGRKADPSSIAELEGILYGADFGVIATQRILREAQKAYQNKTDIDLIDISKQCIREILKNSEPQIMIEAKDTPQVILIAGVNGVGKTTTVAKLAYYLKNQGKQVLLGACDTFRAAANEQIVTWSQNLGLEIVESHSGSDAAAVAYDALKAAYARNIDVLLLDTAGRLHTKSNLMEELQKMIRVLKKFSEEVPQHKWIVVDGSIGSNSLAQVKAFHEAIGLTGLIVTKLDGTSRGGALVEIYSTLKLPIYYVGTGEKADDLHPFNVEEYVDAVFTTTDSAHN